MKKINLQMKVKKKKTMNKMKRKITQNTIQIKMIKIKKSFLKKQNK